MPSITESLAATVPDLLVGATDWCTHPADLDVVRVRGTKNPDLAAIAALEPDLVVANKEENRELDVRRLRERGIEVWVTVTETVDAALDSLDRLFGQVFDVRPAWLAVPRAEWADAVDEPPGERRRGDLARPVDGGRPRHLHRRRAPAARAGERVRRPRRPLPVHHARGDRGPPARTSCCCPTSPTCSPPPTAPRRSPPAPRWSAAGCSPGTARPWSAPGSPFCAASGRRRTMISRTSYYFPRETPLSDLHQPQHPVRFVTASSLFDGHDASINIMRRILQSQGAEVIHLGHNRSVQEVVDAASRRTCRASRSSSYQGGHVEYFEYLVESAQASAAPGTSRCTAAAAA